MTILKKENHLMTKIIDLININYLGIILIEKENFIILMKMMIL